MESKIEIAKAWAIGGLAVFVIVLMLVIGNLSTYSDFRIPISDFFILCLPSSDLCSPTSVIRFRRLLQELAYENPQC